MKKIINMYCSKTDTKEKIEKIFKAGYDGIFLGIYEKPETISLKQQVKLIKKHNGFIPMIHCSYEEPKLSCFWSLNKNDCKIAKKTTKDLLKQLKISKKYNIKNFILHPFGSPSDNLNPHGLKYIEKLLKKAENLNINLCIENLYTEQQFDYIFNNLNSENLKVCYDIGHRHCFTPNFNIVDKYGEKITTLHIHDNHGNKDEHLELTKGNIDLDNLAKELSKLNNYNSLSYEIKLKEDKLSIKRLKENLQILKNLEKNIIKYKKCN